MCRSRPTLRLAAAASLTALAAQTLGAQAVRVPAGADTILIRWVEQVRATGATPGFSVAVVAGDSLLVARGTGIADVATGLPVTDGTRFYIASTTKALTALAASALHERRAIDLDAPLASYLPDLRLHAGLSPDSITLRDLLAMRSGIGEGPVTIRTAYTGEFTTDELLALLREHPPASSGRAFRYANIGYNVAGLALERRLRAPWQELVRREVLAPLGMTSTVSSVSSLPTHSMAMPHEFRGGELARIPVLKTDRTLHAAGGHYATASDLGRLLIAEMNGGRVRGSAGVSPRAVAATQSQTVTQDRPFAFLQRTGWGLGWDIARYDTIPVLQRNGGFPGHYSHVSFMPGRRIGVVVLTNGGQGGSAAETIAQGTYDLLLGRRDLTGLAPLRDSLAAAVARARNQSRTPPRPKLPRPVRSYAGRFRNALLGTLVIEPGDSLLVARIGDSWGMASHDPSEWGRNAADVLIAPLLGDAQRLVLRFDANGRIDQVRIRDQVFLRVADTTRAR